jgi:hypothetical protein
VLPENDKAPLDSGAGRGGGGGVLETLDNLGNQPQASFAVLYAQPLALYHKKIRNALPLLNSLSLPSCSICVYFIGAPEALPLYPSI